MKLCSRCKKNIAVIFVTKIDGGVSQNQGLCVQCARELGLKQVDDIMEQMGIDPEEASASMQAMMEQMGIDEDNMDEMDDKIKEMIKEMGVSPQEMQEQAQYLMNQMGLDPDKMAKGMFPAVPNEGEKPEKGEEKTPSQSSPMSFLDKIFSDRPEDKDKKKKKKRKSLDTFGTNLTKKAAEGGVDRVIGRDREIARAIQILNRRSKNNPVLLGEPGVGKTAIAEGLALRIVEKKVPAKLYGKEVYLLDFAALVAGTQFRGQFESRIKALIEEVKNEGNIILVIDELHNIMGAGNAEGAMNAANILKPALARGEIQIIGATTLAEYRKNIEKDSALERRFQPVLIDEPTVEDTIEILKGIRDYYENYHKVTLTDQVIEAAAVLSERYIHDRFLPDKAIDVIDEAASKVNLANDGLIELVRLNERLAKVQEQKEEAVQSDSIENYQRAADLKVEECRLLDEIKHLEETCYHVPVTLEDVAQVIEMWTKIPVGKLTQLDAQKLLSLEEELHKRVIGQDKAVSDVARAVRRSRAGIMQKKRPVSFLFVGPTGVGKTELVKAMAQTLFGSEEAMIRLDMSEYMEKHSVSKMIGSPPGYVGYDEAGQLTEKVRRNPYSIILLDEMEKAHEDVSNMLLQILDDGHITDSQGRVINFENTIIVMTSNAGSNLKTGAMGFGGVAGATSKYEKALRQLFRPEFLNRIDEIVEFTSLDKEQLLQIVDLMLQDLREGLKEKHVELVVSEKAKELVLEKGYEPAYGARPLRRVITSSIEDKAADMAIRNELIEGKSFVVDEEEGEFVFRVE